MTTQCQPTIFTHMTGSFQAEDIWPSHISFKTSDSPLRQTQLMVLKVHVDKHRSRVSYVNKFINSKLYRIKKISTRDEQEEGLKLKASTRMITCARNSSP